MTGSNRRKLIVVAAACLLVTGCANESLGPEYGEISEQESGLQFYAPGLASGYRKFIYGQDEQFIKHLVGVYGPAKGTYPRGQLFFIEMPPDRHFTRVDPPQDMIGELEPFENRTITHGPAGTASNAIGRIDYAAFLADDLSCVVFRQPFGMVHDAGRGTRLLDGYYCKGEAPMMTKGEAMAIVGAVGHRQYGPIEPPDGWPGTDAASEDSGKDALPAADILRREEYIRSADAYFRTGDYDRAIRDYTEAIRLDPEDTTNFYERALAHRRNVDSDRALADFSQAIRIATRAIRRNPGDAANYNERCWIYGLMGRPRKALEDCNESLRLKPDVPNTLDSRALAYWLLNEHDKAKKDLERARQINPDFLKGRKRFREFEGLF